MRHWLLVAMTFSKPSTACYRLSKPNLPLPLLLLNPNLNHNQLNRNQSHNTRRHIPCCRHTVWR